MPRPMMKAIKDDYIQDILGWLRVDIGFTEELPSLSRMSIEDLKKLATFISYGGGKLR